jgi:hypothetical protein
MEEIMMIEFVGKLACGMSPVTGAIDTNNFLCGDAKKHTNINRELLALIVADDDGAKVFRTKHRYRIRIERLDAL